MTLCELCRSIPLGDLPPFPNGKIHFRLGRHEILFEINNEDDRSPRDALGVPHHPNLDSLREASAAGCELCYIIETQVNGLISDIEIQEMIWHKSVSSKPHFDLWLTRRLEGDGFIVLTPDNTNSWLAPSATARHTVLVLADPLATVFRGRLPRDTLDTAACHRFASWIVDCNNQHPSCATAPKPLPTRLIDVGSEASGDLVKLVEFNGETRGHYVTLSYCWGGDSTSATTRSNVKSKKEGICLRDLPQTFQDTIRMTRALDIQYLWIDRLCIYQDDSEDWERESSNMGSIYANAYLCISATWAASSTEGLVPPRNARPSVRLPHASNNSRGYIEACLLPVFPEMYKRDLLEFKDEALSQRGWTFQERLFSRRNLLFVRDKVYFGCGTSFISEDGIELIDVLKADHTNQPPHRLITDQRIDDGPVPPENVRAHWHELVTLYSLCKLTYPADKLPAISGIAQEYGKVLGDTYVAGLWEGSLVQGLSWQSSEECTAVSEYRAPSWSWASVDGPLCMCSVTTEPIASVMGLHIEVDGKNPYGRVKSGWIKIEAPLVPLVLSGDNSLLMFGCIGLKTSDEEENCLTGRFDTINSQFDDPAETIRAMKLFGLVITDFSLTPEEPFYFSLLVTPTGDDLGVLKRVGWTLGRESDYGPLDLRALRSIVTLV
ncbi:Heterokaryon incompatibility [Aspergillus oryzae]|uniref:Heterokaryon incompatibility n=1 Tax=Aspergillus oryzae TaxID=5062 RepID=A0A1S9D7L3_ASPOZ|nr:Heterokaryon incompatibility [Aspergillus oryzae]